MKTTAADRIKRIRDELEMTLQEFGALLGVTKAAAHQWESGATKSIKPEILFLLQRTTGYSAEWVVTGDGPIRIDTKLVSSSKSQLGIADARGTYQPKEQLLIKQYRTLDPADQVRLHRIIDALASADKDLSKTRRRKTRKNQ